MKRIANEKGGTLLYVLLVFTILLLFAPLLLSFASNRSLHGTMDRLDQAANQLALSSMEAFIAYLDAYQSGDRPKYFDGYPGFLVKNYRLPEGYDVSYAMVRSEPAVGKRNVQVSATVSAQGRSRSKSLTYQFQVNNPSTGPDVTLDDSNRVAVADSPDQVFYQNNKTVNGTTNALITKLDGIQSKIDAALTAYFKTADEHIAQWKASAIAASCSNPQQIGDLIQASSMNPVILHFTGYCVVDDNNFTATWGSVTKPVILIFDGFNFNKQIDNLTVYGNLIFQQLNTSGQSAIHVKSAGGGLYGNLYLTGNMNANGDNTNKLVLTADNHMWMGSINLNNNPVITAANLYVKNQLTLNNGGTVTVSRDILAGSLMLNNHPDITARLGDILIKGNLTMNNGADFVAGGTIAAGDTLTANNNNTFDTGSRLYGTGSSSLLTGTNGSGSVTAKWNPVRQ